MEFHLVSNGSLPLPQFVATAAALRSHLSYVHLREKLRTARELFDTIRELEQVGIAPERIIINDRVDVAYAAGVGGVQLSYHSLGANEVKRAFPTLRIGCSVHSIAEAQQAEHDGADYVLFGHIFPSFSKPGVPEKGVHGLSEICASIQIPVIAIGGITPDNIGLLANTPIQGIAVISGIMDALDPVATIQDYRAAWEQARTRLQGEQPL